MIKMKQTSAAVREAVGRHPLIRRAMAARILNYSAAARAIRKEVESLVGRDAEASAIVSALARMESEDAPRAEKLEIRQLLLKSGLSDIALRRNERTITLVESTRQKTDFGAGETLIETLGDHEINVVTEERIAGELLRNVSEKDVLRHYERVCELCIYITENMSRVPGVFAAITLHLAANDINVLECFSTLTEFSVVVEQEDAQRAYAALQELVAESSKARKR
ncbi:hypothetical protein H0N99_04505 [Candidatus Micrarchaeota archaeon]|nr:hypothetical protein [Candidatus Micrarchaeota archaeon]